MMRTETFEAKVKECVAAAGKSVASLKLAIDPVSKSVMVELDEKNGFKITGTDLGSVYEHSIRILKGYGPKPTRVFKKKDKAAE